MTKPSTLIVTAAFVALVGCASQQKIPEQDVYTQPNWYAECEQEGSEGLFWWGDDFVYACGMGVSRFEQAAEAQAKSFAVNSYAERINGRVESSTDILITDDQKNSETSILYEVPKTAIQEHLEAERSTYKFKGKYHVFLRLKMSVEDYEKLRQGVRNAEGDNLSRVFDHRGMFSQTRG
ncbi:MAG: hypothetical protein RI539_05505 [Spiribacter sp.]|jgi:hypothetical protein|nr:hypothetical protein [Spiribacter sp.]